MKWIKTYEKYKELTSVVKDLPEGSESRKTLQYYLEKQALKDIQESIDSLYRHSKYSILSSDYPPENLDFLDTLITNYELKSDSDIVNKLSEVKDNLENHKNFLSDYKEANNEHIDFAQEIGDLVDQLNEWTDHEYFEIITLRNEISWRQEEIFDDNGDSLAYVDLTDAEIADKNRELMKLEDKIRSKYPEEMEKLDTLNRKEKKALQEFSHCLDLIQESYKKYHDSLLEFFELIKSKYVKKVIAEQNDN